MKYRIKYIDTEGNTISYLATEDISHIRSDWSINIDSCTVFKLGMARIFLYLVKWKIPESNNYMHLEKV